MNQNGIYKFWLILPKAILYGFYLTAISFDHVRLFKVDALLIVQNWFFIFVRLHVYKYQRSGRFKSSLFLS